MRSSEVIITVVDELFGEKKLVYDEPRVCVIGRARDCDIRLPLDPPFQAISRHHCLLEIDPPSVRVRDLRSTNGTYVNGTKIGAQAPSRSPILECPKVDDCPATELHNGDEVGFAVAAFRIRVQIKSNDPAPASPVFPACETHRESSREGSSFA
jgi:eukaryotic-like serine/threonine-protein kinase